MPSPDHLNWTAIVVDNENAFVVHGSTKFNRLDVELASADLSSLSDE